MITCAHCRQRVPMLLINLHYYRARWQLWCFACRNGLLVKEEQ